MRSSFVVFDIWGDYAHFRKYYTTSSPLTFSIPPRTALIGLVSAILGYEKDDYLRRMTKTQTEIAMRILNPIKKVRMGQNLIDTKGGYWRPAPRGNLTGRTQIRFEYLKDPKFRVYFHHKDEAIQNALFERLREHKSFYTPSLGLSELLANFSLLGEVAISEVSDGSVFLDINTALPLDAASKLQLIESGKRLFKERLPTEMLPGRVVTEYREVLYEIDGKSIKAKVKEAVVLKNNDVITPL